MFHLKCTLCSNDKEFTLVQDHKGNTKIECINSEEHDRYLNGLPPEE